jgi:hypothetical protein
MIKYDKLKEEWLKVLLPPHIGQSPPENLFVF